MIIIFSPDCLKYSEIGHPESPERVGDSFNFLKEKGFKFIEPKPAIKNDLLLVHSERLINEIANEKIYDLDTPNIKGIFNYALLSVGGAIEAMEMALAGENAFSLMRPPGHHAGCDSYGGFCYFNNLAVVVKRSLKKVKRVAILDIDCHHGNGTEEIFLGQKNVLYASLHQSPLYPGTGLKSQLNCFNFPLLAGTEEEKYLEKLDLAIEEIKKFKPNLLAVSAGFDTYEKDPLTSLGLKIESYQKIGEKIAKLKIPTFAVLEGGYSSDLPKLIYNFANNL